DRVREREDVSVKVRGFGSGEDQGNPVAMFTHPLQPLANVAIIRGIEPDKSPPGTDQPVPPADWAGIIVKRPECLQDLRWRTPIQRVASIRMMMAAHAALLAHPKPRSCPRRRSKLQPLPSPSSSLVPPRALPGGPTFRHLLRAADS